MPEYDYAPYDVFRMKSHDVFSCFFREKNLIDFSGIEGENHLIQRLVERKFGSLC